MAYVTTRAEYQWNDALGRYTLISREGYEYDGQWALATGGDSPPPAPDPRIAINEEARLNRINQVTPLGSLIYSSSTPSTPQSGAQLATPPTGNGVLDQLMGSDPNLNAQLQGLDPNLISGAAPDTARLILDPRVQALLDQQLQSDSGMLGQALTRQGQLPTSPIDLSAFGPIQSQINTSGINFSAPQMSGLPGLNLPTLQGQIQPGQLPAIPTDPNQFRSDVEQAVFQRGRGLLDPLFSDQERTMTQQLANRGLPTSGEAYDRDFTRFFDARNRAYGDLANQSVITGGQEASRALGDLLAARGQGFGEALAGGTFANQAALLGLGAEQGVRQQLTGEQFAQSEAANQAAAQNLGLQQQLLQNQNAGRAQALSEEQNVRGNQFNELAALLGLQQVQQPGLQNFFAPAAVDVSGAYARQQAGQMANYNASQQQNNALLSGLFGLGGAFLGGPIGAAAMGSIAPQLFGS